MANIIDYVRENQDTFEQRPLNRVDSLVLSWIANMRISENVAEAATEEGVALGFIARFADRATLTAPIYDPANSEELLRLCARSERFANVMACRAVGEWSLSEEKQFAAVTFKLGDGSFYIAFRGTDNTLVGWKENFNLAFQDPVPAQVSAVAYLELAAEAFPGTIYLGGHSKGGNLAVYATMMCNDAVRARIGRCFSHDGPGFTEAVLTHSMWAGAYDLVDRTIPEESIVGLLLEYPGEDATVVRSTNPGIMQHAPFSWEVSGTDFATSRAISYDSYQLSKRLRAAITELDVAKRERFVDALYAMALATGEDTFSGLMASLKEENLSQLTAHLDVLPEATRDFFLKTLDDIVATVLLGPASVTPTTPEERTAATVGKLEDLNARMNDRMAKIEKLLGN